MDRIAAERMVEAIENEGGEASIRDEYSGRGMYGRTTCAVVAESRGELYAAAGIENVRNIRIDNMGRRFIAY
jgi:hypothetical protein